ncbi:hypothetical protein [Streptomyces sp. HPF1205]|uniref:hypothetical protein n=1 Tax=Streptomyces sp. HPF1205 TaxID=2873262 RepID=UPI001CEDD521|nr:hypothetical protein [Streptomyces sp. HPF1205]
MAERSASAWVVRGTRVFGLALLALLILVSGGWESWKTAHYVMLTKGRERGTVTLVDCGDTSCTGPFAPKDGTGTARSEVTVSLPVRRHVGDKVQVVMKPGTRTAIRSGWGGILFAWVPLGGALLLAAVVVGGGLRLARPAWVLATAGAAVLLGAFLTL